METEILFTISDKQLAEWSPPKENGNRLSAITVAAAVSTYLHKAGIAVTKITTGHSRSVAGCTCLLDRKRLGFVLFLPATIDTRSDCPCLIHLLSPRVSSWWDIVGLRASRNVASEHDILKFRRLLEHILRDDLHALNVKLLSFDEAEALSEFH